MIDTDFIRAICDNPDDDLPRLVYADWLEEHGKTERAEFIRVQIAPCTCTYSHHNRASTCERCRRARELLHWNGCMNAAKWFVPSAWYLARATDGNEIVVYVEGNPDRPMTVRLCRGFVEVVSCTLADWCGTECPEAADHWTHKPTCAAGWECRYCHGSGRLNAHGPSIVACQPIREVRVIERGLSESPRQFFGRLFADPVAALTEGLVDPIQLLAWARKEAVSLGLLSPPVTKEYDRSPTRPQPDRPA